MLRDDVERHLRADHLEDGYLFPAYDDYCFANVPHTITDLLDLETGPTLPFDVFTGLETDVDVVLVVLIDGLGWQTWRRHWECHVLLQGVTEAGVVTPLTTVYPSETTAAMTTFHTGRLPAEHGGIGWNIYEPATGESFEALNFAKKDGTPPTMDFQDVFDARSLYHGLSADGVDVHHVTAYPRDLGGVTTHPFDELDGLAQSLAGALAAAEPPAYVFTYVGAIDAVSHDHGTKSGAFHETLTAVCGAIAEGLSTVGERDRRDTLLVVTADHGHVNTDPGANVELATVDGLPEKLATDRNGDTIRFAGNPRNVHLHLRDGARSAVRSAIEDAFEARVFGREAVLDRELFGAPPSRTLHRRLPDLLVTPYDRSAWWAGREPGELDYVGMHGGLHPDEMLVPFAAVPLVAIP